jgi:hypothetical protein
VLTRDAHRDGAFDLVIHLCLGGDATEIEERPVNATRLPRAASARMDETDFVYRSQVSDSVRSRWRPVAVSL